MNAAGYCRISVSGQSEYSIDHQIRVIKEYCQKNNLDLIGIFKDEGESSYTFDRPDFKALEAFIKENKTVKYLIISDLDRLSRNLAEALLKIKELHDKYKIKVLATSDNFDTDFSDPSTFILRAFKLMMAESELHRIRQRTRNGMQQATLSGRFLGLAPYGYENKRDENNKAIIVINEPEAEIVREIFKQYLRGMGIEDLRRYVKPLGFKRTGNSTLQEILSNPVYSGYIKSGKKLIKGIHLPLITEQDYWLTQERLKKKSITKQANIEVPLRGVLRCFCGRLVTAGNSKGRNKYYWYYLCPEHRNNLPAKKLHEQFNSLLENLSIGDDFIEEIKKALSVSLGKQLNDRGEKISKLKKEIKSIHNRVESIEEKYLTQPNISKVTYNKVVSALKSDEANIQKELVKLNTDVQVYYDRLNDLLPKLADLRTSFNDMPLEKQRQFINVVFDNSLYYSNSSYRTSFLHELFVHKELELKEKGLLIIEKPFVKIGKTPICAPERSSIESFADKLNELEKIFAA